MYRCASILNDYSHVHIPGVNALSGRVKLSAWMVFIGITRLTFNLVYLSVIKSRNSVCSESLFHMFIPLEMFGEHFRYLSTHWICESEKLSTFILGCNQRWEVSLSSSLWLVNFNQPWDSIGQYCFVYFPLFSVAMMLIWWVICVQEQPSTADNAI